MEQGATLISNQVELITRALVTLIRQHHRLQSGFPRPVLTVTIDDLALMVRARTDLAVEREAVRNLIDVLADAGILERRPADHLFEATTYWLTNGGDLDRHVNQFLAGYRPRWEEFRVNQDPLSMLLARYESLWRTHRGGLPHSPTLPVLTWLARLFGDSGLLWLQHKCDDVASRPAHRTTGRR